MQVIDPRKLTRWRAALSGMLARSTRPKLICVGDSTTFGAFSSGTNSGEQKASSYPSFLARLLTSSGLPAHANALYGDGSAVYESNHENDGRLRWAGGWSQSPDTLEGRSVGGQYYRSSSAGTLSFTPTAPVDTFAVWYVSTIGSGTLGVGVKGSVSSLRSTSSSGADDLGVTIVTVPLGLNALDLWWSSGGPVGVTAIEAYDSAVAQISVVNAGWSGATTADYAVQARAWSPSKSLHRYMPDLTLVSLGLNDILAAVPAKQFQDHLQTIVTAAGITGDVALVTFPPIAVATSTSELQRAYRDVMVTVADANGITLIDNWSRFGSYEAQSPLGYYGDDVHLRDLGYADFARGIRNVIAYI